MLNITRFPLQISISSPSRPGVNHLQWPAWLDTSDGSERMRWFFRKCSDWWKFDPQRNRNVGCAVYVSQSQPIRRWLVTHRPMRGGDNSLRMTQRMSQRHYRHWVRDIRTRGSLCWPLRLINIASTATRASRGWWNGGCRGNMGQNATITFISSTNQIPLV